LSIEEAFALFESKHAGEIATKEFKSNDMGLFDFGVRLTACPSRGATLLGLFL
jgi:hypothetical protein